MKLVTKRHKLATTLIVAFVAVAGCFALSQEGRAESKEGSKTQSSLNALPSHLPPKDFLASLEAGQKQTPKAKEAPVYVTTLRFVLSLALVLGLAYATILALKRFTGMKTALGSVGRRIRVVENTPLGANRALHLVEVGQRRLVLASTPSQVNLIAEMSAEDLPEPTAPEPPAGFKDQLATFLGTKPDSDSAANNVARMLRDSTAHLQGKIGQVGSIRRRLRDA